MTQLLLGARHSEGTWLHTGHLTVSARLDDGTLVLVMLPDDWKALVDRVTALETHAAPNSLEDLTYGG